MNILSNVLIYLLVILIKVVLIRLCFYEEFYKVNNDFMSMIYILGYLYRGKYKQVYKQISLFVFIFSIIFKSLMLMI
jgi:hypothetical protein